MENLTKHRRLKPYIDMNTKQSQKPKSNFEKYFFKLMKKSVFGKLLKIWENIEILNRKEKKLFSIRTKLSYYKIFHRKFISNKNKKNSNINE